MCFTWVTKLTAIQSIDLDDAIRFLGVCVGFGFTGTLYFMVEVSLIGTGIAMAIQLDKARDAVLHHVGYGIFVMSFFIALVVQMIQKRITNMLFIKSGTRFSLQNRSPLLHYWYFMMFTSMTRALTSYIIRTLKLILRYPLFSLRVDRNAETWSVRRGDGGKYWKKRMIHCLRLIMAYRFRWVLWHGKFGII